MKKVIIPTFMFLVCLIFVSFSAMGDTILFPYIASDGVNVTTIVSVVNKSETATNLTYIYRYKNGGASLDAGCTTQSFTRSTHANDLVTFDVAGIFESGNAMYNDPDVYGGSFSLGLTTPVRGYLLITHSDSMGNRIDVADSDLAYSAETLTGEAVLLDITSGAAWGYRAQNDIKYQDFSFEIFSLNLMMEYQTTSGNYRSGAGSTFTFFPRNIWTTKLFITPLTSAASTADMSSDLSATIKLITAKDPSAKHIDDISPCGSNPCSETEGVFARSGTVVPKSSSLGGVVVKCVGAIDLWNLLDSTQRSQLENTGGWAIIYGERLGEMLANGKPPYFNAFKLEYVFNNSTYGGTNNNAVLISAEDALW